LNTTIQRRLTCSFLIAVVAIVVLGSGRGGAAVGGRRGFRRGPIV
jgi:hypothetical protein